MVCLSGFELYSRWVPLINAYMTHVASPVINSVPLVVSVKMNTVNYKPRLTQRRYFGAVNY